MLQNAGLDIVATDAQVVGPIGYGFQLGRYRPLVLSDATAAVRGYPTRSVFCSWPTQGDPWALDAVQEIEPGRRLALIGDGPEGVTGTPDLYEFLKIAFEVLAEVDIPQFPKCRDKLTILRRR